MKKLLSVILSFLLLFSVTGCDNAPSGQSSDSDTPEIVSVGKWNGTIVNANSVANSVYGNYTDAARSKFVFENNVCSLLYDLTTEGEKGIEGLFNKDGKAYFENTSDVFIVNNGKTYSAADSNKDGRMNCRRLGYYYHDFRFCDQIFENTQGITTEDTDYYDLIANSGSWNGNDVNSIEKDSGVLSFKVTTANDPFIYADVNYSASDYDAVKITVKTEYSENMNFFVVAGSQQHFNGSQFTSFTVNAGEWTTLVVPLYHLTDYTGSVTKFRIDCGDYDGETIRIKNLKAVKSSESSVPVALERIFHTYPDKMHEVVHVVATADFDFYGKVETQTAIPVNKVEKIIAKNAFGEVSSFTGFNFSTTEFVGFDVKDAGVFGIIMPSVDSGYINVRIENGNYVITRGLNINGAVVKGNRAYYGHRLYTSNSHEFGDLKLQAYIERNPLSDITVENADASFGGYDAITGSYVFNVDGVDFNQAYYLYPDTHYKVKASVNGDNIVDRTIYVQIYNIGGGVEGACLLDENDCMLPVPLEVCKNFCGEMEEPIFDPTDYPYSEVYFPLTIAKDESKRFTAMQFYQNWGNYPLKQLSSVAYFAPYYHLSVGVTETNCIAPYYVFGKDGWVLPDFRANSAPLWEEQPQHHSAGRLYFLQYTDWTGNSYKSELQGANIASSGPIYADITTSYLSDDGKIKATYRHAEMAQTDENRTYYTVKLEVLDDVSFNDFKNDFSFFTFDCRSSEWAYSKIGYSDQLGNRVVENVTQTDRIINLGKTFPYFDYFGSNSDTTVNFGLIVKNSNITIGGQSFDGNFVLRDRFDGSMNYGSLSLNLDNVTLKRGDVLEINMILLPWGSKASTSDRNVIDVRQDACINPFTITVLEGQAYEDNYIPSVRAVNDTATFTLTGGKNTCAVRVYGFTDYTTPQITFKADGVEKNISVAGVNGYDGYCVYRDADGTYSFSFNVNMDLYDNYEITVKK